MKFKRKLTSLNNKTGERIKKLIQEIINNHTNYKKCFFWTPPNSASQRRDKEFKIDLEFILNSKKYLIKQQLNISCKNYYFSTHVFVNEEKKNITCLKKIINQ